MTDVIKKFKDDKNYFIKSMVEVMWRELIFKHLRSLPWLDDTNIKVINTSDIDDVIGGVDIIISLDNRFFRPWSYSRRFWKNFE